MRTNRPIQSDVKGERLIQREAIDATSWAYMKALREHNKTKRILDVDPYAEVYQFRDNMYGLLIISADGMGDAWMYLIVGPEKALLIDTGFGIGNLKGLADELSGGKPLIVANTHCHFDHAYGNCQFERAYCHELEVDVMNSKQDPHIWDYLFDESGKGIWLDFPRADIVPFQQYEVVGVPDGYTFDLGDGYEVELVWLPGHSAGHAAFLDKHNRILHSGDGIISMRVGMGRNSPYATIAAYRQEMAKLAGRLDEFDAIFPGHFIVELENTVVPSIVATCDAILADPNDCDYTEESHGRQALLKFVRGLGTLGYNLTNVYAEGLGDDINHPASLPPLQLREDNIPIPSAAKTQKVKPREPIEERCWAFMREVRSHHDTKRVLAVDPYAEVYNVRDNVCAILSESLGGGGDVWSYLIIGPEKALLIDTGFGVGDLKGLASELSGGKPVLVAITHVHPDHSAGNAQFDRVYGHEYSVPQMEAQRNPHIWDGMLDANGQPIMTIFDPADIIAFHEYEIVGVPDGYTFNLGGDYDVELIWTAGHTSGHCVYLDKKSRLLFAGDDAISMRINISGPRGPDPFGQYATVKCYLDQMTKLAARLDEFDYVFSGHFVYDLESYVIEDLVEAASAIVADPQGFEWVEEARLPNGDVMTRYHKHVKGLGTIGYTPKGVGV